MAVGNEHQAGSGDHEPATAAAVASRKKVRSTKQQDKTQKEDKGAKSAKEVALKFM